MFRSSLRGLCLAFGANDGEEGGSFFTMIFGLLVLRILFLLAILLDSSTALLTTWATVSPLVVYVHPHPWTLHISRSKWALLVLMEHMTWDLGVCHA